MNRGDEEQDTFLLEVSRLILRLVSAGDAVEISEAAEEFHEDGFLRRKWAIQPVFEPVSPIPLLVFQTVVARTEFPTPTVSEIHSFLKSLFFHLRLPKEVGVLAMVYIQRLISHGSELRACTWKPVLLSSLLVASKIWEDIHVQNIDFSDNLKSFTITGINKMERTLAKQLQWHFFVTPEEYSDTFYALKQRQRSEQQKMVFRRATSNLHD